MEATTPGNQGRIERLLHADSYRVEELAELLGIDEHVIRHAVYQGDLHAERLGKEITAISRGAVLEWLKRRPLV